MGYDKKPSPATVPLMALPPLTVLSLIYVHFPYVQTTERNSLGKGRITASFSLHLVGVNFA